MISIFYQNCGSPNSAYTVNAASCLKVSVFKNKYPTSSPSFDVTSGGTCTNGTSYTTMVYDSANDKIILSGGGVATKTYSLAVGSGSCTAGTTGGDTWSDGSAGNLSTSINTSLQVSFSGSVDISCSSINL